MLATASAEDDVEPFERLLVQTRQLFRGILEVTVHDGDPASARASEPGRDGGMLAEVPAQPDGAHSRIRAREPFEDAPAAVGAAIVDEDDLDSSGDRLEAREHPLYELLDGPGTSVDRDDDADLGLRLRLQAHP
jgi:hypothetical protein